MPLKAVDVLSGADKSAGASLLRAGLVPLALLHRIGLEAYLLPYEMGLRKRARLGVPTVAIGNLTSGGTGKTPMAQRVASALQRDHRWVVLLSRGHGGSHEKEGGARVVSRGDGLVLLDPQICGDEPALLAHLLPGVPVVVGKDRRISGRLAIEQFSPDAVVLDDALQFWQLERDLNIVLLDARRPFDNGWMLPRGLLREPPSHLKRAGIVVLTRADRIDPAAREALTAQANCLAPDADIFCARHAPVGWIGPDHTLMGLDTLAGVPAIAVTGISDGADFVRNAANFGANIVFHYEFSDHHAYNSKEVVAILAQHPDTIVVTTEKDRVKLDALWPNDGPGLWSLRIGMQIGVPDGQSAADQRRAADQNEAFDIALGRRLWR